MSKHDKLYYKTCREQANLTQEEAAAILGVEPTTLSRYENGHIPVNQDMVAAMIKVYRTPSLAQWHIEHANPDLVFYLRMGDKPITDGDVMLKLELARNILEEEREALLAIFRDGTVDSDEILRLNVSTETLKNIAAKILAAISYLEAREVCK